MAFDSAPVALLTSGMVFPDALSGGAAAAHDGYPLLLTTRDCQPAATAAMLQQLDPGLVLALGGSAVVSDAAAAGLVCGS